MTSDERSIECQTCIGFGTTACSDCIVNHVIANDDGPIDFVVVPFGRLGDESPAATDDEPDDPVVSLFARAGLLDEQVQLVGRDEFDALS